MTDQHGYKIDKTKWEALKLRVDSRSKRILKLCNNLLEGRLVYDELTETERNLVNKSGCLI